jgi:hypothetical protein
MIAGLLLANADAAVWRDAIVERNVLGFRSPLSAQRVASLLRARLESLWAGLWPLVHRVTLFR